MKKNAQWQRNLLEIKEFKKELKNKIGKSNMFTIKDLELYVKKQYNEEFYDSLEELYNKRRNMNIYGKDLTDYIDCLGYDVINKPYKVVELKKNINGKEKIALVFYNYENDKITNIYLEGNTFDYIRMFGIFEQNGEEKFRTALKRWYGVSETKAKRLVKKLE